LGRILAYVTGTVDQELLAWNEYLAAENRILKVQLNGRLKLSDAERAVLGEIGPRLGRQVLADIATIDRDAKFTRSFRAIVASGQVQAVALPARSPNLNACAGRWVRSVKEECLSKVILFGERLLRRTLSNYLDHFHAERNHQGKGNVLLFPQTTNRQREGRFRAGRATTSRATRAI
jgi:hypothetical protein